jgi:hypothetical protein
LDLERTGKTRTARMFERFDNRPLVGGNRVPLLFRERTHAHERNPQMGGETDFVKSMAECPDEIERPDFGSCEAKY